LTLAGLFSRWGAEVDAARARNREIAAEVALDNLRRIQWLALTIVALNLVHAMLFHGSAAADSARVAQWRHELFLAHATSAVVVSLLGLLAVTFRLRWPEHTRWHQACAAVTLLAGLAFAATVTAIDQRVTPNITPFLIGSALVGIVILQRPLVNLALYAAGLALFYALIGQTQLDPAMLGSNRVNGLTAAVLGWLLATMSWRKTAVNLVLTRQLAQRQRELEAKQTELRRLATRDGLTGLYNRATMDRLGRRELARAARHGLQVGLLVIDLDHFKRINDRWGHPAGDAVLTRAAKVLKRSVRKSDFVARLGGEEFMVLLPHTDAPAAAQLAEKLRERIAQSLVPVADDVIDVTASIGVAATPAQAQDADFSALYLAADRAMYRAKAAGRNCVVVDAA
jgi:diguanylate cyclase (GGDEF)-like protein